MGRLVRRVLLGYLLVSLVAGVVLGEFALHPWRRPAPPDAAAQAARVAAAGGARLSDVRIAAADGEPLRAWHFARTREPRLGTVLVAHGHGSSRHRNLAYAAFLLDAGFDVLVPDARGHGDSGGVATYGVLEAEDVQRWAGWVRERRPDVCLYALGASMGAAQLLLAEARKPTFCALAGDAPFATFLDAGLDRIGRFTALGRTGRWLGRPAAYAGLGYVRVRYGIDLRAADPAAVTSRIHAPILLIHGDADRNTPLWHSQALVREQPAITLWVVPGAGHGRTWAAEPQAYPRRIVAFFRQHG